MKPAKQAALTAAFEKGKDIGYRGRDGVPGSLSLRTEAERRFYWAGFKKGQADLAAYHASPEYARAQALEKEYLRKMGAATEAFAAGDMQECRKRLNDIIGL